MKKPDNRDPNVTARRIVADASPDPSASPREAEITELRAAERRALLDLVGLEERLTRMLAGDRKMSALRRETEKARRAVEKVQARLLELGEAPSTERPAPSKP
jgi:hypothetical protein